MAELRVNRFFLPTRVEMLATRVNNGYNPWPMELSELPSSNSRKHPSRLFAICVLVSLLLHFGIGLLLVTKAPFRPEIALLQQQPTMVRLVDKPPEVPQPEPREMELDQPPVAAEQSKPTEPARLAERDQRVEKEQAPRGRDSRDQAAQPATSSQPPAAASSQPKPQPKPQPATPARTAPDPIPVTEPRATELPKSAEGTLPSSEKLPPPTVKSPPAPPAAELPSLAQLTQLTPSTIARSQNQGARERIKEREGLEDGDTVWLNLEKGLLISFFRRFRNQIEGVWNYPMAAIRNEIEGILLLKITIDRQGELLDVELLKTSGSDLLDYEAIEAVYRGAPFGPLPKHYPHQQLKIFAHFSYILSGKYIYGR